MTSISPWFKKARTNFGEQVTQQGLVIQNSSDYGMYTYIHSWFLYNEHYIFIYLFILIVYSFSDTYNWLQYNKYERKYIFDVETKITWPVVIC